MNCGEVEPKVLVVGYGNPLRGDDGAGWQAAERLESVLPSEQVLVLIRHQLTPEIAEPASNADLVIFIDASCVDEAGHVSQRQVEPAEETALSLLHEVNAMQLLGASKLLFNRCPPALLFSVGGVDFSMREGLTPKVQEGVDKVVQRVERHVKSFLGGMEAVAHPRD